MKNQFSLFGKKVLLSGSGGYFGPYFIEALLYSGATVIATDRDEMVDKDEFRKACLKKKLFWYVIDLYDNDATMSLYAKIQKKHGPIDVLINNAFDFSLKTGFNDPSGRLEKATFEQLESSFESGVYWAIRATQFFGLEMKKNGGGSIVNTCSMYASIVPSPRLYEGTKTFNPPGYSMAKAGLLQFTKYSSSFLAPEVRVNAISPGVIPNTETKTFNAPAKNDPVQTRLKGRILLNRMGHPKDLVGALVFLASDASSYITGQNIPIDGGIYVTSY